MRTSELVAYGIAWGRAATCYGKGTTKHVPDAETVQDDALAVLRIWRRFLRDREHEQVLEIGERLRPYGAELLTAISTIMFPDEMPVSLPWEELK